MKRDFTHPAASGIETPTNNDKCSARAPDIGFVALPTGNRQLALNYLTGGLFGLLGSQKSDADVRFHGYHALFTSLCFLAGHAIFGILGGSFLLLQSLTDLAGGGFSLFQVFRAYQNRPIAVPIISAIARKQAQPIAPPTDQTLQ